MKTKEISRLIRHLWIEYAAVWVLTLGISLLYETGVWDEGALAHDGNLCYIVQTLTVLLTLLLIPMSLKIYHQAVNLSRETKESDSSNESATSSSTCQPVNLSTEQLVSYRRWNEVRLGLLAVVAWIGTSVYYTTLSSIGGLCALMGLIATLYCLPTRQRVETELLDENEETDSCHC